MSNWLGIVIVVLVVWVGLSLVLGLLEFAIELAGLLALPAALFAGYLLYRRSRNS